MDIVTGLGPRVGTSWVMSQLSQAGLPVNGHRFIDDYAPRHLNPQGYWDLLPSEDVPPTGISKVWYPRLRTLDLNRIHKLLMIERQDKQAQLRSIEKSMEEESKLSNNKHIYETIDIRNNILETMKNLPTLISFLPRVMYVYTENLNNSIADIITFFKEEN